MFGKSSLKLGLAVLYVVINISGISVSWLFSVGDNSCSLVNILVFIQALSIVSWGYSLQIKKNTYVFVPPIDIGVQYVFFWVWGIVNMVLIFSDSRDALNKCLDTCVYQLFWYVIWCIIYFPWCILSGPEMIFLWGRYLL